MLCEAPTWEGLLGWLMPSSAVDVLATGGGGVVVKGSVERRRGWGGKESVSSPGHIPSLFLETSPSLAFFWEHPWLLLSLSPLGNCEEQTHEESEPQLLLKLC